jgi:hypothetical protein
MKKYVSVAVMGSLILATSAVFAQGSIPLMQGRSSVTLQPANRVTISLAKLTPKSPYQVTCNIADPDNTPSSKGAIDIYIANASTGSISVNGVGLSNPPVHNYVLQSQDNTLLLQSVTTSSPAAVLSIRNQSTVSKHDLTVSSCSATPVSTSSSEPKKAQ